MENDLKNKLINARKDKHWSQADLAKALNVNLKNVQRWEQGSSKPSFEAAAELAKALGLSLDFLAGMDAVASPMHADVAQLLAALPQEKLNAIKVLLG